MNQTKKPKHFDESCKASVFSLIQEHGPDSYPYIDGIVMTPHGIVSAFSQKDCAFVSFIHRGRTHRRRWSNQGFTKRGLVRKAAAFAREIAGKKGVS